MIPLTPIRGSPETQAALAAALAAEFPDRAGGPHRILSDGWDCLAGEAEGWIVRVPRTKAACERLRGEPAAAALFARHAPLSVPVLTLRESPVLYTVHRRVPGRPVDPANYEAFDDASRDRLADILARTFAAAHAVPAKEVAAAGIGRTPPWPGADALWQAVRPRLEAPLAALAADVIGGVAAQAPDRAVFGHFDTHGWNMAYDDAAQRLVGLFDFGNAGLGPRHTDLSYPSFVAPDLTHRVVVRYRDITGVRVDLDRVFAIHIVLRLVEVAKERDDVATRVWALTDWVAALERHRARLAALGQGTRPMA